MLTQSKFLIGKCSSSLSPKPPKTWSVMMILLAIIHKTQAVSCHLTLWIAQGHQQGSKDPATTLASGEWPWTGHAEVTSIWESHSDSITSSQMPVHLLWFTNSTLIKSVVFVVLWYVCLIYILDGVDAVVDMANWTIPPCISNLENEGGTPLDCKLWGSGGTSIGMLAFIFGMMTQKAVWSQKSAV